MSLARIIVSSGIAVVLLTGYLACAEGTAVENPATAAGAGGGGPGGGGGRGGAGEGDGDGDDDDGASKSSARSSSAATSVSTASGGDGGGGEGGGGDGGAGATGSTSVTASSSSGSQCDFTSPNQCATAESLGTLPGDESALPISATGNTSRWFKVRITEEVSSIFEEDLSWRVSLVSPAGMNYDLFVHEGPQSGDVDCNGTLYTGVVSGNAESTSHGFDDDGGDDDSVWLAIEVRYVSGEACSVLDTWTLTIEGYV